MAQRTVSDIDHIIQSYREFTPMTQIAKQYNVTRQRIWQILKQAGINTSKNGGVKVTCDFCGTTFQKPRCQVRKRLHCFCSVDCYYNWLEKRKSNYEPWRHGMRIARKTVSKYFNLKDHHIVHHEDGDNKNNELWNLKIFENQGDHIRYHRGFDVTPIWEGNKM